jgi:hypothetical protein
LLNLWGIFSLGADLMYWVIMRGIDVSWGNFVYGPYDLEKAQLDYDNRVELYRSSESPFIIRIVKEI